ncbi:MAG: hypothetical protein SVW57_11180, partial [Thermodesulfobacteriota bacterium]|nr:hypothetical protein [Thermodesulfobacteriota bacterium]
MIKQGVWIRILVFINVLLGFVVFVSCAPEIYLARKNLRKDPLHKDNIPEKPVCPIDGLWKDPYHGYKS